MKELATCRIHSPNKQGTARHQSNRCCNGFQVVSSVRSWVQQGKSGRSVTDGTMLIAMKAQLHWYKTTHVVGLLECCGARKA